MTLRRAIKKVGGSLVVIIPRDLVEAMHVTEGSPVNLTLVGRQMVVEPTSDELSDHEFRRALGAVLRSGSKMFQTLADYDRGRGPLAAREKPAR